MMHSGRAAGAALKLILLALGGLLALLLAGWIAKNIGTGILAITWVLVGLWAVFAIFTFYFFRDPDPTVPIGANLVLHTEPPQNQNDGRHKRFADEQRRGTRTMQ